LSPLHAQAPAGELARAPALAVSLLLSALLPAAARAQITGSQVERALNATGARVDALTILGGDFGFSDGNFHSVVADGTGPRGELSLGVTKIGGDGEIGDPMPIDSLGVGWQPRVQGSAGYLESKEGFDTPLLAGDTSMVHSTSVEFGGGARLWTNDHLSFAPTVMMLYGHTSESYAARSAFSQANFATLRQLGLIDWSIDTLSLRPALNAQYIQPVGRARLTFSIDGAAFLTRSLSGSGSRINVAGDSGFLTYKGDLDIPTGVALDGHELRTGGYVSRTDLFGELRDGLAVAHLQEVHVRLVADFLSQVWKVQWLGIGASYVWGDDFSGWTIGADVAFRF
jgi:hypothetical protein